MRRRFIVAGALLAALAMACGGSDDPQPPAATAASVSGATVGAATATATTTTPTPAASVQATAVATSTVAATAAATASAEELAAWAHGVCGSSLLFDQGAALVADGVDTASLSFAGRLEREGRNNAILIDGAGQAASGLAAIEPPAGTARYHGALYDLFSDYALLLDLAQDRVEVAASQQEIDDAYIDFALGIGPLADEVRFQASRLHVQAQEALAGVEDCGALVRF